MTDSMSMRRDFPRFVWLALFTGVSLILYTLETFLPAPVPGGKVGLSQFVTLLLLFWFGWKEALGVLLSRLVLAGLLTGGLFGPSFVLGLGGGVAGLAAMEAARRSFLKLSLVGVSVMGAAAHNLAQLVLAYLLFVRHSGVFYLLPYFFWVSAAAGTIIGLAAHLLGGRLERAVLSIRGR
jgi:heptaprenyl diphosphate synthase